jgi:hypothetical protein
MREQASMQYLNIAKRCTPGRHAPLSANSEKDFLSDALSFRELTDLYAIDLECHDAATHYHHTVRTPHPFVTDAFACNKDVTSSTFHDC